MATEVVHINGDKCFDVIIDRRGPWGNPFSHLEKSRAKWLVPTRDESISAFRKWLLTSDDEEAVWMRENIGELRGKRLACWCRPKRCHGEILAALADGHPFVEMEQMTLFGK